MSRGAKVLYAHLERLRKELTRLAEDAKAELFSCPEAELLTIELEFQGFLQETAADPDQRFTKEASARLQELRQKQEIQKKRRETWDPETLMECQVDAALALTELADIMFRYDLKLAR